MQNTSRPEMVIIVPYRDRMHHRVFFIRQMSFLFKEEIEAENIQFLFVHQHDKRMFNRGAMKNIGFLTVKRSFPENYKDITLVFHDIDTLPFHRLFDYKTDTGKVKHYYGFETALGGIVSIKAGDFERVNGYPNYWGWGMEDACLQNRVLANEMLIDRSEFYKVGSPEILQFFDGVERLVCKRDPQRMKTDFGVDGITSLHNLVFDMSCSSLNANDQLYDETIQENIQDKTLQLSHFVNVRYFLSAVSVTKDEYYEYDLRNPTQHIVFPQRPPTDKTRIETKDWVDNIVTTQHQRHQQHQQHQQQHQQHQQQHQQHQQQHQQPHPQFYTQKQQFHQQYHQQRGGRTQPHHRPALSQQQQQQQQQYRQSQIIQPPPSTNRRRKLIR